MANSGRFLGAVGLRSDEQAATASNEVATSPYPAAPHHRLEEPHELRRCQVAERALQQRRLRGLGDARRVERHRDPLVCLHRARHRLQQPAVALDVGHAVRLGREEQRLGVIASDSGALHRAPLPPSSAPASRLARYSMTRRRLASESRFASISFDAAAIERSTASRRSSRIAFSFSLSISLRARSSSCSYCSRAWASSAARSFSATARARSASSSCCWMRRSRSSTALSRAGQPSLHSSASRTPKTTRVQKISPVLMEKGVNSPSWTSSSAGI